MLPVTPDHRAATAGARPLPDRQRYAPAAAATSAGAAMAKAGRCSVDHAQQTGQLSHLAFITTLADARHGIALVQAPGPGRGIDQVGMAELAELAEAGIDTAIDKLVQAVRQRRRQATQAH